MIQRRVRVESPSRRRQRTILRPGKIVVCRSAGGPESAGGRVRPLWNARSNMFLNHFAERVLEMAGEARRVGDRGIADVRAERGAQVAQAAGVLGERNGQGDVLVLSPGDQ